jgi:hypothetical protein
MNLRWLWFDYIDPNLPISKHDRRSIRKRATVLHRQWRIGLNRYDLMGWIPTIVTSCILAYALFIVRVSSFEALLWWMALAALAGWLVTAYVKTYTRRPWVLRAAREAGYDICQRCGYWLRGLPNDVAHCPECGAARQASPEASP